MANEGKLDDYYIKMLELMDKIIEAKIKLEDSMKNGFFLIGKSRYIMGSKSITAIQIPTDDCEMKSVFDLSIMDESLNATEYKSFSIHENKKNSKVINEQKESKEDSSVRKRIVDSKVEGSSVEDVPCDSETPKKVDSINWFSALPPQSLRQSQQYFKEAILKIAEIATMQSKLNAIRAESQALKCTIDE